MLGKNWGLFKFKADRLQLIVVAKKYICVATVHQYVTDISNSVPGFLVKLSYDGPIRPEYVVICLNNQPYFTFHENKSKLKAFSLVLQPLIHVLSYKQSARLSISTQVTDKEELAPVPRK